MSKQSRRAVVLAGCCLSALSAIPAAGDGFDYDFGPCPDGGFSIEFDASVIFLNRYQVTSGNRLITAVTADFSDSDPLPGMQITAGVWSDPNGDGNPSDAVLLGTSPAVAASSSPDFTLTTPVDVGDNGTRFFVGVFWSEDLCGDCIVMRFSDCSEASSWRVDFPASSSPNPNDLSGAVSVAEDLLITATTADGFDYDFRPCDKAGLFEVVNEFDDGIVFLNRYVVEGGNRLITRVDSIVDDDCNSAVEVTAGVWSDPNNDGNPSDAVLLGTNPTVSAPVDVGPDGTSFFVGVYWRDLGGDCIIMRVSECSEVTSWRADFDGVAPNPNDLSGAFTLSDTDLLIFAEACPDCNGNGIADSLEDCNGNEIADECEIDENLVYDCDCNGVIDECEIEDDPSLDLDNSGFLDSCEQCPDIDCDGIVTFLDLWQVIFNFGQTGVNKADVNFDGVVNFWDYLIVAYSQFQFCDW